MLFYTWKCFQPAPGEARPARNIELHIERQTQSLVGHHGHSIPYKARSPVYIKPLGKALSAVFSIINIRTVDLIVRCNEIAIN